ncbi:MAG: hypothetical protein NTY37_09400 [Methanothrix sp.]|nr:hypothetical protein [Methanothrix sp.]
MEHKFCYVCDVLGYKNILINLPLDDQLKRITDWNSLIIEGLNKFGLNEYAIISDTVFVSAENIKENLKKLLNFSKYMLTEGTKRCFPIRGAIAFGDVVLDNEKHLAYGKAAASAYNLMEEQDWIGTCCETPLPSVDCLWDFDLIFVYPAPMKGGSVVCCPVVSWDIPGYADLRRSTIRLGLTNETDDMSWKYANRIQNTIILKWYLNGAKRKIIKAKPSTFQADLPIKHIDDLIGSLLFNANLIDLGYTLTQTPDGESTYTIEGGPTVTKQVSPSDAILRKPVTISKSMCAKKI